VREELNDWRLFVVTLSSEMLFIQGEACHNTYLFSDLDSRTVRPSSGHPRGSEEGILLTEELAREVNGYHKTTVNSIKKYALCMKWRRVRG
jgi:hypothetical protein